MSAGPALRGRHGQVVPLDLSRWRGEATRAELTLLDGLEDPVIDLGCGPGRIVAALAEAGRRALGVDASASAVAETQRRGCAAVCRSVFDPLPAEGRWRSVVLLDGNIGIGGDPTLLLERTRTLLAGGGTVLVEVDAPGSPTDRFDVRLDLGSASSHWFPWARVSADQVGDLSLDAGLLPEGVEELDGRWFARAVRP